MPGAQDNAAHGARPDRGLKRGQRLVRSALFAETYAQHNCYRGRLITLWVRKGPGAALRLGVVTSRKVGESVARSRARRLMREAFRLNRQRLAGDCDVILSARDKIAGKKMKDVADELLILARRAGIRAE